MPSFVLIDILVMAHIIETRDRTLGYELISKAMTQMIHQATRLTTATHRHL